jgi:hypothetical protein
MQCILCYEYCDKMHGVYNIKRAMMSTTLITSLVKELANIMQNFSPTAVSASQIPGQWYLPSPNSTWYPINSQSFVQWIMTTAITMHDSHWRMVMEHARDSVLGTLVSGCYNSVLGTLVSGCNNSVLGTLVSGCNNPNFSQWLMNK